MRNITATFCSALIFLFTIISCVECFSPSSRQLSRPRLHHAISIPSATSLSSSVISQQRSRDVLLKYPIAGSSTMLQAAPLDVMVSMYKDSLMNNPLETKLLTGGLLAFLGDAIAQSQDAEYDQKRAASFVAFDLVYRAVQCALFPYITKTCDGHFFESSLSMLPLPDQMVDLHYLATLEQTFANQFIVIPIIYYPVFFSLTGWVQGMTLEATIERAENTIVPLLKRNWLFWIPVQYFQFGYVDEPLQIPFLCVAGLAWTFILSAAAGSIKSYGDDNDIDEQGVLVTSEADGL
jgi:protein Mpv17